MNKSLSQQVKLKKLNILYIESDKQSCNHVINLIEDKINSIIVRNNTNNILETIEKYQPDILMGEIDNFKFLRDTGLIIPIIIITKTSDYKNLLDALEMGIEGYIPKPICEKKLLTNLYKVANNVEARKENDNFVDIIKNILNYNNDIILVFENNRIIYENKTLMQFFGVTNLEEFRIKYSSLLEQFIIKDGYFSKEKMINNCFLKTLVNTDASNRLVLLKNIDNDIKRFLANVVYIQNNKYLLSLTDVTQLDKEKDSYKVKASTDHLTGSINKAKFDEILEEYVTQYKIRNRKFSIIMCDIDYFKKVNDTYGHIVGDSVLKEIVEIFKDAIRSNDTVARWGGEEFVIILQDTTIKSATKVAKNLRETIEKYFFTNVGYLTCSFGVAEYINETKDIFIDTADKRLYLAKKNGRNLVISSN